MADVRGDLQRIAKVAAKLVDGDLHKSLTMRSQMGSEAHKKALAPLIKLHQSLPEISYIYTVIPKDGAVFFILNTTTSAEQLHLSRPPMPSAIMELYQEPDPELLDALYKQQPGASKKSYRDKYGAFMSGYAPFYDGQGNMVGIAGVDLAVDDLDARIGILRRGVFSAGALALALALVAGGWMARSRQHALDFEKKQNLADAALRQSETRYRSVVDNLQEVVFQTDAGGNWSFLNPSWTHITGYSTEDCLGKNFADYIHPEDRGKSIEDFKMLISRLKDFYRAEVRFLTPNSGFRWIEFYAQPSLDENSAIIGTTGTLNNITERKEVEESLRLNKERLQLALGSSEQGLWDWNISDGRVYYDAHWASILGYRLDEIEEKIETWRDSIHPADSSSVQAALDAHWAGKREFFDTEHRARHKNGEWIWIRASGRVIERDIEWHPLRMIGTIENISRRKAAEAQLQQANRQLSEQNNTLIEIGQKLSRQEAESRKLAHIVAHTDNAVILTDTSTKIVWVNEAFQLMTGYSSAEVIGKKPGDFLQGPETDPKTIRYMREQLQNQKGFSVEILNYSKTGKKYWLALEVQPIFDEKGALSNYMAIERDVTERRQFLEELEHAKETAEAANHAKSDFLAVMSHEIRTPMNGVIGFSNLLLDTKLDAHQRDFVENIHNCANSLLALINDILDFSKIESSHLELEEEPLDLRSCIEDAFGVCTQAAMAKGLELVCDFSDETPEWITGDVTRLRQVLVNLVGNAVKFTETGEVTVTVEPVSDGERTGLIKFRVRDTGIGVPQERLSRLFKPFSQADSSTTRRYGGSGLGLAICKRLVELMGGSIGVESTAGKGSVFYFTIAASAAQANSEQQRKAYLDNVSVLLVDDNKASRNALGHLLQRWRMRVSEVADAETALARLQNGETFDLVIMDRMLGGTDGIELARNIRSIEEVRKLPIILLSSLGVADSLLHARAAGIQATLNKPVRYSQLHDAITRVMWDSGRLQKPAAPQNGTLPGTLAVKLGENFPLRILLAEDFPVNQRIASLMLKKIGYNTDVVTTGKAAVEAVRGGNYDLVLMDMHMPEMDGLEATREIRREETEAGKPVGIYIIALTADAMAGDREKCIASGMNDYLSKPLRPQDLQSALQRFVQN
jgi:PAS domain S-box-containing protein